jgi:ribosome-associated protein
VSAPKTVEDLQRLVMSALEDAKAVEPVALDVRGRTSLTDLMFVVSGTSSRHVKSIADNVLVKTKAAGVEPTGIEGEQGAEWILVDLGDAVIHVMLPKVRETYRLEAIWGIGGEHTDDEPVAEEEARFA